jgi:N-acetylmuramoyl-L-alanine amidase
MKAMALVVFTAIVLLANQAQDSEHPEITASSSEFQQSAASSIALLRKERFVSRLETPSLGSTSNEQFEKLLAEIRAEKPIPHVDDGQSGIAYDVILQPGHYGRQSGAVGTTGQLVSERALVSYMTSVAAESLRRANVSVLVVSADHYPRPGLKAKVFLAIHADGNAQPCSTGPSIGYQSKSSLLAMHAVGWSLGAALGYSYNDFNRDNFTANEASYYMFRQVKGDRLSGLLEVGELTCSKSERQLIGSSTLVGDNIARALQFIVQTPQSP